MNTRFRRVGSRILLKPHRARPHSLYAAIKSIDREMQQPLTPVDPCQLDRIAKLVEGVAVG